MFISFQLWRITKKFLFLIICYFRHSYFYFHLNAKRWKFSRLLFFMMIMNFFFCCVYHFFQTSMMMIMNDDDLSMRKRKADNRKTQFSSLIELYFFLIFIFKKYFFFHLFLCVFTLKVEARAHFFHEQQTEKEKVIKIIFPLFFRGALNFTSA